MNKPTKYFTDTFSCNTDIKTDESLIIRKNNVRLSLLTERLLRVEVDPDREFIDAPTQTVINRNFCKPQIRTAEDGDIVIIMTTKTIFRYDTKNEKMIGISLKDGKNLTQFNKGNLKGTYRTLDMTTGPIALGDGLMSTDGVAVIDDSLSLTLNSDGTLSERKGSKKDEYYFCYNHDYRACLKDFFSLCGEVPLVPRYCLGNWWSRYKAYTQQEYIDLMNKFIEKEIPITVATIDMDWHWVDVKKRFNMPRNKLGFITDRTGFFLQGDGWTGYSWNTELFPDYKGFLKWLHEKNFKVTVNLHPAQGVRFFEDMYEEMCEKMGVDPKTKARIEFDITDPKYVDAYFNVLHKPYENDGVDFWWIDWQQGKNTKLKNLDPLWALNHYHTLANTDGKKRPLILSRYAEVGSHRYPLGFSGDTKICWSCLDFQPYFTATATNIGYTWWSHDIGGHMSGSKDDELYTRWVQYGIYSPIMRLHSTSNEFMGKEPWKHEYQAEALAVKALRERHAFIPYLYSMNYRTHKKCLALCEPMYYEYPENEEAYKVKNQYFFGSELMVAPITTKLNPKTNLACVNVWLPEGRWTDIYTGAIYEGGKMLEMYRGIESIPVLAKEGAIIPLSANDRDNDCSNPKDMLIRIYRGNNEFELYEDDGETNEFKKGNFAITKYNVSEKESDVEFTVSPAEGNTSSLPQRRNYTFKFEDIVDAKEISVTVNGKQTKFDLIKNVNSLTVCVKGITPKGSCKVLLSGITARENSSKKEMLIDLVTKYQLPVDYKRVKFNGFVKNPVKLPKCDKCLAGPLNEVLNMK
ncbi:MAG: TIM-barrel domain-containing protein [Acutalibacteraceae bacterium]